MPPRMEFDVGSVRPESETKPSYRPGSDQPFRILVAGDFTGRDNRGAIETGATLVERPIVAIDVDRFDDVLFRYAPRLTLPGAGPAGAALDLEFKSLEDFHPDTLFDRLDVFAELRSLRDRLRNPSSYAAAADELKRWAGAAEELEGDDAPEPDGSGSAGDGAAEDDASTLERLLGKRPASAERDAVVEAARVDVAGLIKRVVEPYILPAVDAEQQNQLLSAVDTAIADLMRAILHQRDFRQLEADWRSLHRLVTTLETDENLSLRVLDVAKEELAEDLQTVQGNPRATALWKLLVERGPQGPGGAAWSVIAAGFYFDRAKEDLDLLAALGAVASEAGGPVLAAARPSVVGARSFATDVDPSAWANPVAEEQARWQALRRSAGSRWIGIALPRLLLRAPYGARTEPVERFRFEEAAGDEHGSYLWGNPAFGCAWLLGQAFVDSGWSMTPGDRLQIDDLPLHVVDRQGERIMLPCAEAYLSERAGTRILDHGVMPWLSFRDRNAARLMRFQSVADPPSPLQGAWG